MKIKLINITTATLLSALALLTASGCSDNSVSDAEPIATDSAPAGNADINNKPLAEQPKAMIDKAQTQVDEINRLNENKLEQIE